MSTDPIVGSLVIGKAVFDVLCYRTAACGRDYVLRLSNGAHRHKRREEAKQGTAPNPLDTKQSVEAFYCTNCGDLASPLAVR